MPQFWFFNINCWNFFVVNIFSWVLNCHQVLKTYSTIPGYSRNASTNKKKIGSIEQWLENG